MAFYGILVNLLFYLYLEMHISFPEASKLATNVVGTSSITPMIGAFLADAYIGRYWTIGIFSTIYLAVRLYHPSDVNTSPNNMSQFFVSFPLRVLELMLDYHPLYVLQGYALLPYAQR